MKPNNPLHVVLLSLLLLALPAQAQIYKYKDASGKTVISDRPPPGASVPTRTYGGTPGDAADGGETGAPAAAAGPKTLAERELEFKKRQIEKREAEEKARKAAEQKQSRQESCERARRQLQILESGERVATRDEKGERVFIEDTQRTAEIERTRKYIAETCN